MIGQLTQKIRTPGLQYVEPSLQLHYFRFGLTSAVISLPRLFNLPPLAGQIHFNVDNLLIDSRKIIQIGASSVIDRIAFPLQGLLA